MGLGEPFRTKIRFFQDSILPASSCEIWREIQIQTFCGCSILLSMNIFTFFWRRQKTLDIADFTQSLSVRNKRGMRLTTVVTIYRDHYQYQHLDKLCVDIQYTCPIVYCLEFQSWISLSSSYCLEFQSWISLSQYDLRLVNKSSQHQYPRIGLGRHIKEKNSTLDLNFNIRFLSIKPVFLCLWSLIYLTTFKVL